MVSFVVLFVCGCYLVVFNGFFIKLAIKWSKSRCADFVMWVRGFYKRSVCRFFCV